MEAAIEAEGLVKTYGKDVKALRGLSFRVEPGAVFALLGPNGAGKSTAVKILTTLATPDEGRATVAGIDVVADPDRVRRTIGVVAQGSGVDVQATGRENLRLQGQIYGLRGHALELRVGNCWSGSGSARLPTGSPAAIPAECSGGSMSPWR